MHILIQADTHLKKVSFVDSPAEPSHGITSFSTKVKLLVKQTANQAPAILCAILAKLRLDDPDIVCVDATGNYISPEAFPKAKTAFDETLSDTTNAGKLTCRFEIRSQRSSFHSIKLGVWDILQQYKVWFKKSAAPVKKISLAPMGFWVNVHPSFASANVFRHKICTSIENNYPDDKDLLTEHNLPEKYNAPEIYLNRSKLNAEYRNPDGTTTPIATEAFVMYANAEDFPRLMALINTQISSLHNPLKQDDPIFI
jgi:hypothetical protein